MLYDFISLADLEAGDIYDLLELAGSLKKMQRESRVYHPLEGQSAVLVFEKPSLRTRVSFEVGMFQLGGQAIVLDQVHHRLGERESIADMARNLERWVDGVVVRTYSHEAIVELAEHASVPVINALTDKQHPCQVIADAQALSEHKGDFEGLKVVFAGDGNNVCASWMHFAARIPIHFVLACPEGYEASPEVLAFAQANAPGKVEVTHDLKAALAGADAVYTDVWASMGQEAEQADRARAFEPYQINAEAMALAKPNAVFMHCLPAKRGSEVTDEVIDGPQSIVYDQAENRLHSQKAIMVSLMERREDGLTAKRSHRGDVPQPAGRDEPRSGTNITA